MKLTPKQKIFCEEYIISHNATQAAIKAGYSKKTARKIGQENLTKPDIKEFIDAELSKTSEKLEITRETQIMRLEDLINKGSDPETSTNHLTVKEFIAILQEENKLLGLYAPEEKINRNLNSEIPLSKDEQEALDAATGEILGKKETSGK